MPILDVDIAEPLVQTVSGWSSYPGRFQASQTVEIRPRVSGYLEKIHFRDGQTVAAGDPLFTIEQAPFEIALRRAEPDYNLAMKEFQRAEDLLKRNVVSKAEYEDRQQRMIAAKATFEEAQLKMTYTTLRSPISGRVSRHLLDVGNLVPGGVGDAALLSTVVALDPIHFYFDGTEFDLKESRDALKSVREGGSIPAEVQLQGEHDYIKGNIDYVDTVLDEKSGTMSIRAQFSNGDHALQPGMFGRLRMRGKIYENAFLIPSVAVGSTQEKEFVYVVSPDGIVGMQNITTAIDIGPYRIVTKGLKAGDRLIVSGQARIRPGMKVKSNLIKLDPLSGEV